MITKRGWRVITFALALFMVALVYVLSHTFVTPKGYCWGTLDSCYPQEFKHVVIHETI